MATYLYEWDYDRTCRKYMATGSREPDYSLLKCTVTPGIPGILHLIFRGHMPYEHFQFPDLPEYPEAEALWITFNPSNVPAAAGPLTCELLSRVGGRDLDACNEILETSGMYDLEYALYSIPERLARLKQFIFERGRIPNNLDFEEYIETDTPRCAALRQYLLTHDPNIDIGKQVIVEAPNGNPFQVGVRKMKIIM